MKNGWVKIRSGNSLKKGEILNNKSAFGLTEKDQFVIKESVTDELGFTHIEYEQYYNNIKVLDKTIIEHRKNGELKSINGNLLEQITLNTEPIITFIEALEIAIDESVTKEFAWKDPKLEQEIKEIENNEKATNFPKEELVIISSNKVIKNNKGKSYFEEPHLVYKIVLRTVNVLDSYTYYIDAKNGDIIKKKQNFHSNGPGSTVYNGTQTMKTKYSYGTYRLIWDHYSFDIKSVNDNTCCGDVTDSDDNWPATLEQETTVHWGLTTSADYFMDVHNTTPHAGKTVLGRADWGIANAGWDPATVSNPVIYFGTDINSLDVCGHEYVHPYTNKVSGLEYEGESGALNESFSDIFGVAIERYKFSSSWDWTIGEDIGTPFRSLSSPSTYGQPSEYEGTNWVTITPPCNSGNDNCGVHTNSGVQNFWFYLVANGGSQNSINISSISFDKAEKIALRNLQYYLTSSSEYFDSRLGSITAAEDLYGECSNEVIQITNAWAAVNVGGEWTGNDILSTASIMVCTDDISYPYVVNYSACSGTTLNLTPFGGFGWTYSLTGPNYNKTLSVTDFGTIPSNGTTKTVAAVNNTYSTTTNVNFYFDDCGFGFLKTNETNEKVNISPNPFVDYFSVSSSKVIKKYVLFDASGKEVLNKNLNDKNIKVDGTDLHDGIYVLLIQNNDGTQSTNKIVKQ